MRIHPLGHIPRVDPAATPSPESCKLPHEALRAFVLSPPAAIPPDGALLAPRISLYVEAFTISALYLPGGHFIELAWRRGERVPTCACVTVQSRTFMIKTRRIAGKLACLHVYDSPALRQALPLWPCRYKKQRQGGKPEHRCHRTLALLANTRRMVQDLRPCASREGRAWFTQRKNALFWHSSMLKSLTPSV